SLTLRVSFGFRTLLSWSTGAEREKRDIKTDALRRDIDTVSNRIAIQGRLSACPELATGSPWPHLGKRPSIA
ncbi:MAG: hypothetical protein KDA83_12930, partial [Planctomycetales bacterium]|nr:hypothetical protein [Planctomycetales bacterium]